MIIHLGREAIRFLDEFESAGKRSQSDLRIPKYFIRATIRDEGILTDAWRQTEGWQCFMAQSDCGTHLFSRAGHQLPFYMNEFHLSANLLGKSFGHVR